MKNYSPFQFSLAAASVALIFGANSAVAQTSVYHTSGFELPRFHSGQLAAESFGGQGQENWIVTSASAVDVSGIYVQSSDTHTGAQAATFDATGQPDATHLRKNVVYDMSTRPGEQVMDIYMRLRLDSSANPSDSWAHQAQAGPGPGSGIFSWDIHSDGRIHYTDGLGSGEIDSGVVLTKDVWHEVLTSVDFTARRYAVWVDGVQVFDAAALPAVDWGFFGFHSFALFGPGDDRIHMDDYALSTRPVGDPYSSLGQSYCGSAAPNSTGSSAEISAHGSLDVALNQFTLNATGLPPHSYGLFLTSQTQGFVANPGGSQGNLCLGGSIGRFRQQVAQSSANGLLSIPVDLTALPSPTGPVGVQVGETWNFSAWYRDANPNVTSNFTDGVSLTFQ